MPQRNSLTIIPKPDVPTLVTSRAMSLPSVAISDKLKKFTKTELKKMVNGNSKIATTTNAVPDKLNELLGSKSDLKIHEMFHLLGEINDDFVIEILTMYSIELLIGIIPSTSIICRAISNDMMMNVIINGSVKINAVFENGTSILIEAIRTKIPNMLVEQIIVKSNLKYLNLVDSNGLSPLHHAIISKRKTIAIALINAAVNTHEHVGMVDSPLVYVMDSNICTIMNDMISKKPIGKQTTRETGDSILGHAINLRKPKLIEFMLSCSSMSLIAGMKNKRGESVFFTAIRNGNHSILGKMLLDVNYNHLVILKASSNGIDMLSMAILSNSPKCVFEILNNCSFDNLEQKKKWMMKILTHVPPHGFTALMLAAMIGNISIVREIVNMVKYDSGLLVQVLNKKSKVLSNKIALSIAVEHKYFGISLYLHGAGSDIDSRDSTMCTPLIHAAKLGFDPFLKYSLLMYIDWNRHRLGEKTINELYGGTNLMQLNDDAEHELDSFDMSKLRDELLSEPDERANLIEQPWVNQ